MPKQAERDPGPAVSERVSVHANKRHHLTQLGVTPALADEHADDVDWWEVSDLVKAGCEPNMALDIRRRT